MDRSQPLFKAIFGVALFTGIALAWVVFLLDRSGELPSLGGGDYHVDVVLPTSANLTAGSRVTVAGVHVGRIDRVERVGDGARVRLGFKDDSVVPLPADSRARLRQHTPIGENYVSVEVGKARATMPSGSVIPIERAEEYVDMDEILASLQGETRERARMTFQSLGESLDGRGAGLNRLVRKGSDAVNAGSKVLDVVHRDREAVSRLVDQLGSVASAVGQRGEAIELLADRGLEGLGAIRDSDEALEEVLRALPPTLDRVRSTSGVLQDVDRRARPTVDKLAAALGDLRPVVSRVKPASDAARAAMGELDGAAPRVESLLRQATKLAGPLPATLPKLHKVVCEVAPMARYIKPYMPDPLGIVLGLGSGSNAYDATGHTVRLAPILNDNSVSGLPEPVLKATSTLLHGGLLSKVNGLNWNFYMKPGEHAKAAATSSTPIGPDEMPATGFKYPRIHADC